MKNVILNALCKSSTRTPNVTNKNESDYFNIYLANSFVSLVSAKRNNKDTDAILVVNFQIESSWKKKFSENEIKIIKIDFKEFLVNRSTKWKSAYFKLEALNYILEEYSYENVLLVDTDTIFMKNINELFCESNKYILFYDVKYPFNYTNMKNSNKNFRLITGKDENYIHYGGEFICGNAKNLRKFMMLCKEVVDKINNFKETIEDFGDEQVISIAADLYDGRIKSANAYIVRFWNTMKYRYTVSNYKSLLILHVPSEKENGMIKIYKRIVKDNYPTDEYIYSVLNMKNSIRNTMRLIIKKIL